MSRKVIVILLTVTLSLLQTACKNELVRSEDQFTPGKRNYKWDSLLIKSSWPAYVNLLWGISPNSVWIGLNPPENQIWHYDGAELKSFSFPAVSWINTIFGFTENNIWAGASGTGTIFHFNGTVWEKSFEYTEAGANQFSINYITGKPYNEVYALGYSYKMDFTDHNSFILKYEGRNWRRLYLDGEHKFYHKMLLLQDGSFLIYGYEEGNKVWLFKNDKIVSEVFSSPDYFEFLQIGSEPYIKIGNSLYKYENGYFKFWKSFFDENCRMWGRGEADIFMSVGSNMYHYNGTDFSLLFTKDYFTQVGVIFKKDLFIAYKNAHTNQNILIRGTVK